MTLPSLRTHRDSRTESARPATAAAGDRRLFGRLLARAWPHAAVVAIVVVLGLPMLNFPFGADQAIFAEIGRTIWQGGMPYTDAWDQKPPAIFLIYAVAIRGPLGLMRNVRAFDLAWLSLTVVVLIELGRRWWTLRAGAIAGLLYGALYVTTTGYWHSAQPDGFIALPLALALLLYDAAARRTVHGRLRSRRIRRVGLLVAAGLLLGFAFQLRFIMALLVPFIPLVELGAVPRRERLRLWLDRMVWLGVGFAFFQGVLVLYLAVGGALGEYIAAARFASGYTSLGGPYSPEGLTTSNYLSTVRLSFLFWALGRLVLTAPAIIGGFFGVFVLRERRVQQLVLFVVLGYVGIAAQAKFFPYHYLYLLPFMALLGGWAWDQAFRLLRRTRGRSLATTGGALLVGGLLLSTPEVVDNAWWQWKGHVEYYTRPEARESYYDFFGPWNGGTFSYRASRETAYYLERRTEPTDRLYVWGYDPLIYLLAQRPSASRFVYSFPLMSDWAPRSWQGEFMEELESHPPVYFVVQRYEGARWITGHVVDSGDYIAWFPALESWLARNYELETEIEDYLIYRRK